MAPPQPKSKYELGNQGRGTESGSASLFQYVNSIFTDFKTARKPFEDIWIECWLNFLGQYQAKNKWKPETEGSDGRSKIFIKITALKCHTAHAKLMDAMFPGKSDVPFDVTPIDAAKFGIPIEVAIEAAFKTKERLREHFKKIELEEILNIAALECAILGTAVLKGPIVERRTRVQAKQRTIYGVPANEIDPGLNPYVLENVEEIVPVMDHVPLWNYYVDVNARTTRESIGEMHFQRLLPAHFKQLAGGGGYDPEAVLDAATRVSLSDENDKTFIQLGDNFMGERGDKDSKVSVLEYQGLVPVSHLEEAGCKELPGGVDENDSIEAIVVVAADGIVIKACVNPLGRRQFFVCPYKKRPGVIYGEGTAESMRDSQMMINSSARMYVDNKALSGNGMVAVNLSRLDTKKTKNLNVYPGKTWYTKGSYVPSDVISSISFQDITVGLKDMIEMFERFADEETGIPKYTQGIQGSFLNKTATGMSMLMGQANLSIKTVMKNIDNYWIEPIVESFYAWFMEMDEDNSIKIPLKVKATGTDSLMTKEIRLENIMKFMQVSGNPQDAIFQDRPKMMREIARLLEVDDIMRPKEVVDQILEKMAQIATAPKDVREKVAYEKLYPWLPPEAQKRLLVALGLIDEDSPPPPVMQPPGGGPSPSPGAGGPPPVQGGGSL